VGRIVIREYKNVKRHSGGVTDVVQGALVTDHFGLPIKTVTTVAATPVDCARLTASTHFVAIESDTDVRYAVRPRKRNHITLSATEDHPFVPAGMQIIEAVYPGAIISFLQVSGDAQSGPATPYLQVYAPVLAF
jgi:hypothetical protein